MTMSSNQGTLPSRYAALAEAASMVEHHRGVIEGTGETKFRPWSILFPHVLTIVSLAPTADAYELLVIMLTRGLAGLITMIQPREGATGTFIDDTVVLSWVEALTLGLEALRHRPDLLATRDQVVTAIVEQVLPCIVSPNRRDNIVFFLARLAAARFTGDSRGADLWIAQAMHDLFAATPRLGGAAPDDDRRPPHA